MSAEQRLDRPPLSRHGPRIYFVGRRAVEPEVYAVTAADVERLEPARRAGMQTLDWYESDADRMELARLLIARVAGPRPSRDLKARFAAYVLGRLPYDGFTLASDDIERWLRIAGEAGIVGSSERPRRSWAARLITIFSRRASPADTPRGTPR
jgi:hypothetical protein